MNYDEDMMWLSAALDDELGIEGAVQVQARLVRDQALQGEWERQRALRAAIRDCAQYYEMPSPLRARISSTIASQAATPAQPQGQAGSVALVHEQRRRWAVAAAGLLAGAALGTVFGWRLMEHGVTARSDEQRIVEDAAAGHIRAVLSGRLVDVESSDQHTVKPWLSARLSYAPPVPDLSAHGFELLGARRDVVDGQTVAALVYQRRRHIISVFLRLADDSRIGPQIKLGEVRGFNVVQAANGALRYWIASDLNAGELEELAAYLIAGG